MIHIQWGAIEHAICMIFNVYSDKYVEQSFNSKRRQRARAKEGKNEQFEIQLKNFWIFFSEI